MVMLDVDHALDRASVVQAGGFVIKSLAHTRACAQRRASMIEWVVVCGCDCQER